MALPVKSEREHRQDNCSHVLKEIDDETRQMLHEDGYRDYKYECVKCNRYLKNRNGVLTPDLPQTLNSRENIGDLHSKGSKDG